MKIVEQSHEILPEIYHVDSMVKRIEKVARVCYQSEGKIKDGSDVDLCHKLIDRGHEAMLEHGILVLQVPPVIFWECKRVPIEIRKYMNITSYQDRCVVSASIRVWRDLQKITDSNILLAVIAKLATYLPALFYDLVWAPENEGCIAVPFTFIDPSTLTVHEQLTHRFISVQFITDRGVTHEMVRHRPCSFAQESTRYVKYDGGTEFIRPVFDWAQGDIVEYLSIGSASQLLYSWYDACREAEDHYKVMIKNGASSQEARSVLPNSLKTEIVATANLTEWKHIFKMRCAKGAHPQIRELMLPLLAEFKSLICQLYSKI